MLTKDEAAKRLIDWHFHVEPELTEIYRMMSENEEAPGEPIKLLEVSEATLETGQIDVFVFGPAADIPYSSSVALITPEEFQQVREHRITLPAGWDLAASHRFMPPEHANGTS